MGSHEGNSLEPVGQTKASHEGCREGGTHLASVEAARTVGTFISYLTNEKNSPNEAEIKNKVWLVYLPLGSMLLLLHFA